MSFPSVPSGFPPVSTDRALRQFLDLVQIDSPTYEEQVVAAVLERALAALGLEVENDRSGPNGVGNIVGRLAGDGAGEPIALLAHMDTVEPGRGIKPRVEDGVVRSDGTTILGADNKQSVAAILEALRALRESGVRHGPVEVVFTWAEEKGHRGAKSVDLARLRSRMAFVFDVTGPIGTIVNEAPSSVALKATFQGRAAHAGIEPERGINAIAAAARAVARMRLGRLDAETTANVGLFHGGTARNAVPELATFEAETRSMDEEKLQRQVEAMRAACEGAAAELGASLELEVTRSYSGYRFSPDDPVVRRARDAIARIGLQPTLSATGGGSDANSLNERGLPTVNLSTGMRDLHSVRESVDVADVGKLAELIVAIVLSPH